jgi:hypothetical protein
MNITVEQEFFGREHKGAPLVGQLLAMFRDTHGHEWFAFELPDVWGIHVIPADSRFLVSIFGE